MIRCVAFDIDGVLVDTKPLHQIAILHALNQHGFRVTEEYHRKHLDGLPTKVKMERLCVPEDQRQSIFDMKQQITFERIENYVRPDIGICEIFRKLKDLGFKTAICSNAIRRFCEATVACLGIQGRVDVLLSNEDAAAKPSPEMYLQAQMKLECKPDEMLICEDSYFGLQAAYASGSRVCYIENPHYLTWQKIEPYLLIL